LQRRQPGHVGGNPGVPEDAVDIAPLALDSIDHTGCGRGKHARIDAARGQPAGRQTRIFGK